MMKHFSLNVLIFLGLGLHSTWAQIKSEPAGDWYAFVLYVREPDPGTGTTWVWAGLTVDTGHSWWELTTNDRNAVQAHKRFLINKGLSFAFSGYVNPLLGIIEADAILEIGYNGNVTVNKWYPVTKTQFLLAVDHAERTYNEVLPVGDSLYNLNSRNCTDVALNAGVSTGQSMPAAYGTWFPNGHGNNPGVLGYNIWQSMAP